MKNVPMRLLLLALSGAIATGCASVKLPRWRSQSPLKNADLTLTAQPTTAPGEYAVSGTAELPPNTELNVLAVRQLRLEQSPLTTLEPKSTYSILTYETVTVTSDRWQTNLTLWQVAPDGAYREAWQLQASELDLNVIPEEEVFFLATLGPVDDLAVIERELALANQRLARRNIQITADGGRFLQTGQILTIDLPTDKTAPIATREEDLNGGWGNRYLELPDLPNDRQLQFPNQRQTDAPVMQGEFLY